MWPESARCKQRDPVQNPKKQNPERTKFQMDKIPNRTKSRIGQNPELDKIKNWTKSRKDKFPKGQNLELDKIQNGQNPESNQLQR